MIRIPSWPQAGERETDLLRQVLESPQWGGFHPFVSQFEQSFAAFSHTPFGISAFNGTVTLELALTALGIGPGDEVIVPAISFISTAFAVSRVGAIPVFVDIDAQTCNLDPERARAALTKKTKAVLAVHFGGAVCDMDALTALCDEAGILLIEDAAHAHGSEWNGRRAGSFGTAGSFSFQNGKVLSSGEGGLLVTCDPGFAARARSIANCGRIPGRSFYEHGRIGTNFRLTALQAAVLLAQFEQLPSQIALRAERMRLLKNELQEVQTIRWQHLAPQITAHSGYLLIGRCPQRALRDELCRSLTSAGVPCTPFYPHTLYQNQAFSNENCRVEHCPVAECHVQDAFWLPHRNFLADEETILEIAGLIRHVSRPATASARALR